MTSFETKARMFAALSATNEAILKARSAQELCQQVCEAAVEGGGFRSAGALFPDENGVLKFTAGVGFKLALDDLKLSVRSNSALGRGITGSAYREGTSQVANDFQQDARLAPWRAAHSLEAIGSAAAVPLRRNGKTVGIFLFLLREANALTDEVVNLLERMVANVSFALDIFERDQQRAKAERANRRLTDMFAALSATNTAILRASDRNEMFQLVCDAVVRVGNSLGAAAIFLKQRDSSLLQVTAAAGQGVEKIRTMELSIDPRSSARSGSRRAGVPRAKAHDRIRPGVGQPHQDTQFRSKPDSLWRRRGAAGSARRVDRHHLLLFCQDIGRQ